MTTSPPPSNTLPEPLSVEDAAWVLVERGWAESYEQARQDLEQARADVLADLVGDGPIAGTV